MDESKSTETAGQRILGWVRRHKFLSVCIALVAWLLLELVLLPYGDVRRLRTVNPSETAFMLEQQETAAKEGKPFKRIQHWIALSRVPKDAINAVIVSEDGTFWSNEGFDWFEFRESIEKNVKEGRAARGASTITQQLVKNLYLSSSKNPLRKLREWVLTWYMARTLSKTRILEVYLNVIEWGRGIYGIDAASQTYFGKSASDLTREESARLAAVIPNPRVMRVNRETPYLVRRTQLILDRMSARGL